MVDPEVEAFIENATPAELQLYLTLNRLRGVLQCLPQDQREEVVDIVYRMVERDDMNVWEKAVENWD